MSMNTANPTLPNAADQSAIPSGYQRTEVGLIPKDWNLCRIDAHALITTGAKNTQDRQDGGQYPFFVRSQQIERINSYSYSGEAVLTAGDGVGTGKVFHYIDGQFDVHQRVYRITDFSSHLVGRYFFYQFSTRFFDRIMSMTAKSSVDSVRMEVIAGMLIPMPSPEEQHAIAEALSDVDGLIGALEKLIAKKRAIKQAAMQQLLTGKTRLPGFTGEWEDILLRELVSVPVSDGPHLTPRFLGNGVPFLSVNNLVDNRVDTVCLRYISREDHEVFSRKCRPQRGDVLLGKAASVGMAALVNFDWEFNVWSPIAVIRPKNNVCPRFLLYALQSPQVKKQISYFTNSSSQGNLGMGDIEKLVFSMPRIEEQEAIAIVFHDMDAEIEALEQRRDKTQQIKQGMMQELLTGRVRLISGELKMESGE